MFDYLQKFNSLPENIKASVSSPAAMSVITELEAKYKIDLAATVMKVMTKIISLADLAIHFVSDFSLDQETAKKLTAELKERLFFSAANYLGYNPSYSSVLPKTALAPAHLSDIEKIIKVTGVSFAGLELNTRFKNILTTYIKGVRNRIDTRMTLSKEVLSGGLGLDYKVIDQIFKAVDDLKIAKEVTVASVVSPASLEKVRALYEQPSQARDIPYDLKQAIATGNIKKPSPAPLNLPLEKEEKLLESEDKPLLVAAPVEIKAISAPEVSPVKVDLEKVSPEKAESLSLPKQAVPVGPLPNIPVFPAIITPTPTALKIVRPPERKPNVFTKIFKEESVTPVKTEKVEKEEVKISAPVSVAALRTSANNLENKKIVPAPIINHGPSSVATPKIMGPLEELQYLDLINFRRLGTSSEAINKIEAKIKLLEKDGYDKMIAGVVAWRSGVINKIYLRMIKEALTKELSLKAYAEFSAQNKIPSSLTWEELEAIMSLNTRLMF